MSDQKTDQTPAAKPTAREIRLAAALRANLARRKALSRGLGSGTDPAGAEEPDRNPPKLIRD